MADYIVSIDNEESNILANHLSITGRVNGINCAAVILLTDVAKASKKEAKLTKQKALVMAFLSRQEQLSEAQGDKVTV